MNVLFLSLELFGDFGRAKQPFRLLCTVDERDYTKLRPSDFMFDRLCVGFFFGAYVLPIVCIGRAQCNFVTMIFWLLHVPCQMACSFVFCPFFCRSLLSFSFLSLTFHLFVSPCVCVSSFNHRMFDSILCFILRTLQSLLAWFTIYLFYCHVGCWMAFGVHCKRCSATIKSQWIFSCFFFILFCDNTDGTAMWTTMHVNCLRSSHVCVCVCFSSSHSLRQSCCFACLSIVVWCGNSHRSVEIKQRTWRNCVLCKWLQFGEVAGIECSTTWICERAGAHTWCDISIWYFKRVVFC